MPYSRTLPMPYSRTLPDKTTSQILSEAADLGEKHGVAKDMFITDKGSMCINGLLAVAITDDPKIVHRTFGVDNIWTVFSTGAYREAHAVLAEVVGLKPVVTYLALWNNSASTKPEEVISALRKASKMAEVAS